MHSDFERASKVVNGYFYTYKYLAKDLSKSYDMTPFIYCLGPFEKNINCFVGINLHHIPTDERIAFLIELEKYYHILDNEERAIVTLDVISRIMPSAKLGMRVYNRKGISDCYRVLNKAVGRYIDIDGDIYLSNPSEVMNKYWREYSSMHTADTREEKEK